MKIQDQTICAVSTPPGVGGIAVIRVSGAEAFAICDRLFRPGKWPLVDEVDAGPWPAVEARGDDPAGCVAEEAPGLSPTFRLADQPANRVVYGTVCRSGEVLDEVLVSVFRAPRSFTGEDTVEISCHGSLYIQQQLMQWLIESGAHQAQPGEFTQRAFRNGKLDLSQAEAVADLIASTSQAMHRMAVNQMRGGFSEELKRLRAQLLDFTSLVELELDFSDQEELEFADRTQLRLLAEQIFHRIQDLAHSFATGNAIKNGIPVAIIGKPNVGKSTLLNALLNEERALVSDIPGTTRDTIEESLYLEGRQFRFIDTAGLRDRGADRIEEMGIRRSFEKAGKASLLLYLFDLTEEDPEEVVPISRWLQTFHKPVLMIGTKNDLARRSPIHTSGNVQVIHISSRSPADIQRVKNYIVRLAGGPEIAADAVVVANIRHYEALCQAGDAIARVLQGLADHLTGDLLAEDIRACLHYLGEITGGVISTDEVLGNIFSRFCIGK
jgi:tRNA modification GTPase